MSEAQFASPADYEIVVTINEEEVNDIQTFIVYRCAITKTASFAILRINLKLESYLILEDDIRNSTFPTVPLKIYEVDGKDRSANNLGNRIKHFCTKNYNIIQIEANETVRIDSAYISCTLYLVNPILHYLNSNNSFNKIIPTTTALDAINDFESFLKSNYGNDAFQFKKVGDSYKINNYIYEHILSRNENDLIVPLTLIQNYKPFHTYAFYFFDDFRLDDESEADIVGYLINIGNKDNFKRRDIAEDKYIDVTSQLQLMKSYSVTDSFNEMVKSNPSIVLKGKNINYESVKAVGTVDVPNVNVESLEETIITGRTVKSIHVTISTQPKKPTERVILYAPDNINNAIDRYNNVADQLRTQIHSIDSYRSKNCGFDVFQFGLIYNIQLNNKSSFVFTPLSIINIFERQTGPNALMQHNTELQFIKFKDDSSV
jgi:hypothetical protein